MDIEQNGKMQLNQLIKQIIYLLTILASLLVGSVQAASDVEWTLHIQKDDYAVYTKATNGRIEVKAKARVKATQGALLALLEDTEQAPEWIANCDRVIIEESPTPFERVVHAYYNAPWPVKDRDMVTYSVLQLDHDKKGYTITITDVGQNYPKEKRYTRMKGIQGIWRVYPTLEKGIVEIIYQGTGNAGGRIPQWLSNKLIVDSTNKTFANMMKVIRLDKYQIASPSL